MHLNTSLVIFLLSFLFSFPLQGFPESVLYSRTLLFIRSIYTSLHLLIPNSQSVPPHDLSPTPALATVRLFSISVSLFVFHR